MLTSAAPGAGLSLPLGGIMDKIYSTNNVIENWFYNQTNLSCNTNRRDELWGKEQRTRNRQERAKSTPEFSDRKLSCTLKVFNQLVLVPL
jgi:hypothetical protein